MKQDWATEEVEKYSVAGDTIRSSARFVFAEDAVKLLRQRDAQWKRVVKRLRQYLKDSERVRDFGVGNATYMIQAGKTRSLCNRFPFGALDDLIAAMKEGRK